MRIRSMTGFGRAHGIAGEWSVDVVLRSVNHRFLDLSVRLRDDHGDLEAAIRKVVGARMQRGKVDVSVRLRRVHEPPREIRIQETLLTSLLERFAELSRRFPVGGRLEVRDLLTVPDLVQVESHAEEIDAPAIEGIAAVAVQAADALAQMREAEARLLVADLAERLGFLREKLARIASLREEIVRRLHDTLKQRLALLFDNVPFDAARLEQEAALLADRSDVSEEVTRIEAHLAQFSDLLARDEGPVGKKLDFLTQEIQREINTLGAKCRDLSITHDVIDMKTETEKVREQVQNLE
jgi:uncharacterized protein (TIGR00255 family)